MKTSRSALGLVVLMTFGASVGCGSDEDGQPVDQDTGTPVTETGTPVDTGADPDTGSPDTAMPDSTTMMDADALPPAEPTLDFQIINVSDWHGQLDPIKENDSTLQVDREFGGLSVLSTYWKEERAKLPTLTATSGDVTGATPPISTRGTSIPDEPAVLAMNFLGLQVDTIGNHNFDRSIAHYTSLIDKTKYTIVSSNLTNLDNTEMTCGVLGMATGPCGFPGKKPDGLPRIVKPYHMLTVGTGTNMVKVAFVGLTNTDAPKLQFPGLMGKITVENPVVRANESAALARKDGAQVVVVLYHQGATGFDPVAMKATGPLIDDVAGMKPELIDLVLGDHSNQLVNTTIGGIKVIENLSAGRTYARSTIKVVKGKVTSVEPVTVNPLGKESTKTDTLLGADMKPVPCNSTTPCAPATPAYACSSTTATNGVCRRAHKCNVTPGTMCPTGWTCSTDGLTCTNVVKAGDPAADALMKPWRDALAAQFDIVIGKTTRVLERGPTCPPAASCPPTPKVNLEREFQQPIGELVTDALLATYKPLGARIAIQNGGGIRDAIPSSYVPQVYSKVTSAGTTPPAIALSGTPAAVYNVKIEMTTGGTLGTAQFRWSTDGGTTWTSDVATLAAGTKVALGTTGMEVTFAAGTYATDNTYAFTTKKFVRNGCSTTNPCDILVGDIYNVNRFNNKSTIRPVTAQTLWLALENGVSFKPSADGRLLHVAGMKYSFSATAASGARIKKITLDDGTVLMDATAATPIVADVGKVCTADTDCSGTAFGTDNFTCVEDIDLVKKCMIKVATNDFVSAGGETTPFKPGARLGQIFGDMADDMIEYVKKTMLLTPGPSNFTPPSTTATSTRMIELP